MKILNILLTFLFFTSAFGQEIPRRDGCIEIMKVNHFFLNNRKGDLTKKTNNNANRPYLIFYLDTLGNVIEKVGFGKQHNKDLKLLDFVGQNYYEYGKLNNSVNYVTDYDKSIYACYKTKYFYNDNNQLIQERELYYSTDSLFMQLDYEYDSLGNITRTFFSPTHYYSRTFDNESKLKTLQQFYDSKLRWDWTYTYTDTTRIGEFKTYYNDGKDYTKRETRTYRNGRLLEIEEKTTSGEGLAEKTVLFYDKKGIISRINYYKSYSSNSEYELELYTVIKAKYCQRLKSDIIERINETIFDE